MSDGLQTIQIMLSDAAAWRGRMEERMDETITTLHTVAASVERYSLQSAGSIDKVESRLAAITKSNESVEERLSALEGARPGGKKTVAVAAGVGTASGALGTLVSNGGLDVIMVLLKKFGL